MYIIIYNTYYTSHVSLVYKISDINAVCRLVSGSKIGCRGWKRLGSTALQTCSYLHLYIIPLIYWVVFVSFSLWSEFQKTQHMLLITYCRYVTITYLFILC